MRLAQACLALLGAGTLLALLSLVVPALRVAAVAVASAGIASWLLANHPLEGRVLVAVAPGNGLTAGDLLAVPAILLVALLVLDDARGRLRSRR